jgi:phytoene dehydrogenase-like protein
MPGAGQPGPQVDSLWLKSRELTQTLRDEQLADPGALDYLARRVEDPATFREMFEKVKKAEAGRFANVVTGIGKSLDEVLKETLSAKKLHSEQREESPPKFRSFIDAYFESLSKAATGRGAN